MWTWELFVFLVLISISQADNFYRRNHNVLTGNAGAVSEGSNIRMKKNIMPFSEDDGSADARRLQFLLSHDSTPNFEKIKGGIEIFGIPIGPQVFISKETDENEVAPPHTELIQPVYIMADPKYDDMYDVNSQQEIGRVPVDQLKQHLIISPAFARNSPSETFPLEEDSREAPVISDDQTRRNAKVTAGLQIFGIPVGPQFIYSTKQNDKENDPNMSKDSYAIQAPIITGIENMAKQFISKLLLG